MALSLLAVSDWTECACVSSPECRLHNCLLNRRELRSADSAVFEDVCVPEVTWVFDIYVGSVWEEVVCHVPGFLDVLQQFYSVQEGGERRRRAEETLRKIQDFMKLQNESGCMR